MHLHSSSKTGGSSAESVKYFHPSTAPCARPDNVNVMRNTAPINHFPPTLFSPNRSPIYGEAHLFSQPASRLVTGNSSLQGSTVDWNSSWAHGSRALAVLRWSWL